MHFVITFSEKELPDPSFFHMKLVIDKFAKIEHATLIIDGITAIAGLNNTGKSTVGKILFSIYNSLFNIEKKIAAQRIKAVRRRIELLVSQNARFENKQDIQFRYSMLPRQIADEISEQIADLIKRKDPISEDFAKGVSANVVYESFSPNFKPDNVDELIESISRAICEVISWPEDKVQKIIISSYFSSIFDNQINPVGREGDFSSINLTIKNEDINFIFHNNECTGLQIPFPIQHSAILLDNPFVIDKIAPRQIFRRAFFSNYIEEKLVDLLSEAYSPKRQGELAFESSIAHERIKELELKLSSVISGHFVSEQRTPAFHFQGEAGAISIKNTSLGIKSFLILKLLIESFSIKEKDVIILDEPEIHLHPQWQVVYAEVIVLLQKYFNLSIIITTHSPYFLDAISLYAKKYGLNNKANYYLAEEKEHRVSINDVTDRLSDIYKMMASPLDILDNLRDEIDAM